MGLLLIAAALSLIAYNLRDEMQAGKSAMEAANRLDGMLPEAGAAVKPALPEDPLSGEEDIEIPDYILNPNMDMPVETINGQDYIGILAIPTLKLELPIINQWSYSRLKIAPCRYYGSAYTGDLIIAAHNYATHFGKLKNLQKGDAITFTDLDGNLFCYEVADIEVLPPTASEEILSGAWDLTLFTCTIGGKSRVTVRCEQAND